MDLLLENVSKEDFKKYLKEFYNYAKKELELDRSPRVFLKEDKKNADDMFGKTGYYDPENEEIHLFISDRHAKDILRSFSHELVHHAQKLDGLTDKIDLSKTANPAYASEDEGLREMERDAFERGNMIFRDWCDRKKLERKNIMTEGKKKTKPKLKNKEKADLDGDGDISDYEYKRGKAVEDSIKKQAEKQAKENMNAVLGKDVDEQEESIESLEENKDSQISHPYPQLFAEKERLLKDAFNKREEAVYQQLLKKFIKQ